MTEQTSQFTISQKDFEGPLTLLMHLIEKRKASITDFSLSEITDEYIQFLHEHPHTISQNSEFIHTASMLLLIKSKALLPDLALTTKEEADISELEERLSYYQTLQTTAQTIRPMLTYASLFRSNFKPQETVLFTPDEKVTVHTLRESMEHLLNQLPTVKKETPVRLRTTVSLKQMIESILQRVQNTVRTSFADCTKGFTEKADVVVGFLALLELAKEQDIIVSQTGQYGTIEIESAKLQTPHVTNI